MTTKSAPRQDDPAVAPAATPPTARQRPHRFSLLTGRTRPSPAAPAKRPSAEPVDALALFASEEGQQPPSPRRKPYVSLAPLIAILAVAAVGEGAYIVWHVRAVAPPTAGTLGVISRPAGAELYIDGQLRGTSPVELSLSAGRHELELRRGTLTRREAVDITAGTAAVHSFDLGQSQAVATAGTTATLELISDPSGARVSIDGRGRGTTPLVLTNLAPGVHEVVLTSGGTTVRRQVRLGASTTALLLTPTRSASPPQQAGWVRIESGVALDVYEENRLIGTSAVDRIMLSAGSHTLRLVSGPLNYEGRQTVQVAGGQTRVVRPELPNGTLSINALPWAEVLVNGERKGETPIGNLPLQIGQHEVVFRHPQLGEQRRSVTVTAGGTTRVGVDLRR